MIILLRLNTFVRYATIHGKILDKLTCWKAFIKLCFGDHKDIYIVLNLVSNSSNLILMELTFKCPISLFRFLTIKDLNSLLILVLLISFFIFDVYSSFNEGVEATPFSSFCQLKMLVKAIVELFCNVSVPLLFKCNLTLIQVL